MAFLTGVFLHFLASTVWPNVVSASKFILGYWPFWLVPILAIIIWEQWVKYRQGLFIAKQKYALFEIKIPREINKSPVAMELFLSSLHRGDGEANPYQKFWQGSVRPWSSLEIVSIEGDIHFFIYIKENMETGVAAQLYAQYHEAELIKVDDYTKNIFFGTNEISLSGNDIILSKDDVYPIKTYVDYGLASGIKEDSVDPITTLLEALAVVPAGHQVWLQILIQALSDKTNDWRKRVGAEVKKVIKEAQEQAAEDQGPNRLTKVQQETLAAIERAIGKSAFEVGIRMIYVSKPDIFNPAYPGGVLGALKSFSAENLNGFKPARYLSAFNYPWQDYNNIRKNKARKEVLEAYKLRSWFRQPYKTKPFAMNIEAVATMFHFPGLVAKTSKLNRLDSRRGDAPSNLPV